MTDPQSQDPQTPAAAWAELVAGNARFASDAAERPRQGASRIAELVDGQAPFAAILGCSDSRVSAELLFDQGLGDLFVVRNAGQVASPDAIASLEYGVAVLGVRLVVVLAHSSCGAVAAAVDSEGAEPPALPAHIRDLIAPIRAAVRRLPQDERADAGAAGLRHLEDTVGALLRESEIVSDAVAAGTLGLVGASYVLRDARVTPRVAVGVDAGLPDPR